MVGCQATQFGVRTCMCDSMTGHPIRDPGYVSQPDTGSSDAERHKLLLVVASWDPGFPEPAPPRSSTVEEGLV